jgi:hypothetical protein
MINGKMRIRFISKCGKIALAMTERNKNKIS